MARFFSRSAKVRDVDGDDADVRPIAVDDYARRIELLDSYEKSGLGWFWATDEQGRIIYLDRKSVV